MFFTKEMIVLTESTHCVLLRFLPGIRTLKPILGFSCSCRGDTKKSPAKKVSLPRTNKQIIYPRCHLDSQLTLRRLAGYQHTPGNSRIPTRCRILRKNPFPCTLSGPFDNLFLTRFSASRVLCKGIVAVISTSTVFNIQLLRTDFTRK